MCVCVYVQDTCYWHVTAYALPLLLPHPHIFPMLHPSHTYYYLHVSCIHTHTNMYTHTHTLTFTHTHTHTHTHSHTHTHILLGIYIVCVCAGYMLLACYCIYTVIAVTTPPHAPPFTHLSLSEGFFKDTGNPFLSFLAVPQA